MQLIGPHRVVDTLLCRTVAARIQVAVESSLLPALTQQCSAVSDTALATAVVSDGGAAVTNSSVVPSQDHAAAGEVRAATPVAPPS